MKLLPVVVQDVLSKEVLMLAYANKKALEKTRKTGFAWFFSRSRNKLWKKGGQSGNKMRVRKIRFDCDRDALLYQVDPKGPACHTGRQTCFGPKRFTLETLERRIGKKRGSRNSYTAKLLSQPWLLAEKMAEEGAELCESKTRKQVTWEAADVLYFLLVKLAERNVPFKRVLSELERRSRN